MNGHQHSRTLHPTRPFKPASTQPASASRLDRTNTGAHPWSCACGGSCPRCAPASAALASAFDGGLEQAAQRAAERVLRLPDANEAARAGPPGHSLRSHPWPADPADSKQLAAAPGQPLAAASRRFFEPRFGHDLSEVRIHTGAPARDAANRLNARAFTLGSHIVFGAADSAPESLSTRAVMAHELAHVLQQREIGRSFVQRLPGPAGPAPAKTPEEQMREDVGNALSSASAALEHAIATRDSAGFVAPEVSVPFARFFAGSGPETLDLLKTRIDEAAQQMLTVPIIQITNPVAAGTPDLAVHQYAVTQPNQLAAAMQPPLSATDVYIALYPPWLLASADKRVQVVMHELFHYIPNVQHAPQGSPTEAPWDNARAYQGIVAVLAGLPEAPGVTAMFPP